MRIIKRGKHNRPPSPPTYEARSCTGKKKYGSESEAMSTLETQRSYGAKVDGVRPYRCGFCGKWHLGHKIKYEDM